MAVVIASTVTDTYQSAAQTGFTVCINTRPAASPITAAHRMGSAIRLSLAEGADSPQKW
jgi:hypothetical protein